MMAVAAQAQPQPFASGSNGSFGPLEITANTKLDLPPDGTFHCTKITVAKGATLSFHRNAKNTPVYLLATENVTIAGAIDVSGEIGQPLSGGAGGPGGFDGGNPESAGLPPGDGHGPGGGKAGASGAGADSAGAGAYGGVDDRPNPRHGSIYGNALLVPLIGGSGGGGQSLPPAAGSTLRGGGGGGGAILIASTTRIEITGNVFANGGPGAGGSRNFGSGGAIRLVAPVVAGNGILEARGAGGQLNPPHGRVRIDTLDRRGLDFNFGHTSIQNTVASVGAFMVVFPAGLPRLDITRVGDTDIPLDSGPVVITLAAGAPREQSVKVAARNFKSLVLLRIVATPDHGPSAAFDFELDNSAVDPAEQSFPITIPENVRTVIAAWTR
jgi:hypothetical protein